LFSCRMDEINSKRAAVMPDDHQRNKRRRIGDRSEDQTEANLHSYSCMFFSGAIQKH
jgi:hypothetical protein